jgi:hypothetical protein
MYGELLGGGIALLKLTDKRVVAPYGLFDRFMFSPDCTSRGI